MFTPRSELVDFFAEHALTSQGLKSDAFLNRYVAINIQKLPILGDYCFNYDTARVDINGIIHNFEAIDTTILYLIAARKQIDAYKDQEEIDNEKRTALARKILSKDYDELNEDLQEAIDLLVNELK